MAILDLLLARLQAPFAAFATPGSDLYWPWFLTAFAAAGGLFALRKPAGGLIAWLFPRSVYRHPSARLDVAIFAINTALFSVPSLAIAAATAALTGRALAVAGLPGGWLELGGPASDLAVTLLLVAAGDFAIFYGHWLLHRLPGLWEFHKVHHAAPVLTPMTAYRQHPVDGLVTGTLNGLVLGLAGGVLIHVSAGFYGVVTLMGHNVVELVLLQLLRHLRHTHVWLSFGPLVERVLISPAQHQIHHSVDPPHWNRNMGQIFAIWDWMFGTLYIPQRAEQIVFGIDGYSERDYQNLKDCYLLPFRKAFFRADHAQTPGEDISEA